MGTSLITPKKRRTGTSKLTVQQRMFCEHLVADPQFRPGEAAKQAGYGSPSQTATKLMRNPRVMAHLGSVLQQRIERCQLTADEVLEHMRNALFLDPKDLFDQSDDGVLSLRRLEDIPLSTRRCISKLKCKSTVDAEGKVEATLEVELMSKDAALTNALKHLGLMSPDNLIINANSENRINWDELCSPPEENDVIDGKVGNEE